MLEAVQDLEVSGIKVHVLKKADLDLTLEYFIDSNEGKDEIEIRYDLEVARDEASINKDNQIAAWNHAKWTKSSGSGYYAELLENWIFGRQMVVDVWQEDTYPVSGTLEYKKEKSFFGLISQENYRNAYLCDNDNFPLPSGWKNITEDNFLEFCEGYYYECSASGFW